MLHIRFSISQDYNLALIVIQVSPKFAIHQLKQLPMDNPKVTSFEDLDVYKRSYAACLKVMKEIVPMLPNEERFDFKEQDTKNI